MIAQNPLILDTRAARVFRLRKSVMTSARLINDRLRSSPIRWQCVMITLTYAPDEQWSPHHISDFLRLLSTWGRRKARKSVMETDRVPYLWVMELTKKGVPHYHVLAWVPARWRVPYPDKKGWWRHGSSNLERARNPVGYVAKYASKFSSKEADFPHGARIHGVGGLTQHEKRVVAWWKLPKDIRTGEEGSCAWVRAPGGGWREKDSGKRWFSPFAAVPLPGSKYVQLMPHHLPIDQRIELADYKAPYVIKRQQIAQVTSYPVSERLEQIEAVIEMRADKSWRSNLNLSEYLKQRSQLGIDPELLWSPVVQGLPYLVDVGSRSR